MKLLIVFCCVTLLMPMTSNAGQAGLQSHAERTDYKETSRYEDVMDFIADLQRTSPNVRVESFGVTNEDRALPLVILANPAINKPEEAAKSDKPIVFVMANIHAGEVEGKEAMQHLCRDILTGSLGSLLDKIILLVAPIYNADGNERIDIRNRTAQNGPLGGVGVRENAQGLDLNRDYMKIESPEARALIAGVFNRWDPHVIIDLHTTNGSYHGYGLTYSPSLNPNGDERLTSFLREKLFPDVTRTLKTKHKYNIYYYGNFADEKNPQQELPADRQGEPKAWATFDYRPRFGNNYEGLRNRLAILSEAYSYLDFRARVDFTYRFVEAILDYVARHAQEVVTLVREADRYARDRGTTFGNEEGFGLSFELKASPKPVDILVGSVTKTLDPRTGKPRLAATSEARPVKMLDYGRFQATRRLKPPAAYILKPDQRRIIDVLLRHGVAIEQLKEDATLEVERYEVEEITHAEREFQKHKETRLKIRRIEGSEKFPAGSFVVPMRQAKAALIFYLLEPESDDGLAAWNYFDEALERERREGKPAMYPAYRLREPAKIPAMLLKP